jgi:hypothetical protein
MQLVARFFEYALLAWFGLLFLLIFIRVLRGDIEATGFLANRAGGQNVEPERALMMLIFPAVVGVYAYNALTGELPIVNGRPSLPDVPQYLLMLLTGSNSLYLAGKIARGA